MDARLMEYVPPDILTATDGLDLDLDLNELMVCAGKLLLLGGPLALCDSHFMDVCLGPCMCMQVRR